MPQLREEFLVPISQKSVRLLSAAHQLVFDNIQLLWKCEWTSVFCARERLN